MATQVQNGKAFEWSIAIALSDSLNVEIIENKASDQARSCFLKIPSSLRTRFIEAATVAIDHILTKETGNFAVVNADAILMASDASGQKGDVRDVIVLGREKSELGISCKTNHEAFKHPRVSDTLDFVKSWGIAQSGCTSDYWEIVKPLFGELRDIRSSSNHEKTWQNLGDYQTRFYIPALNAFSEELWRHTNLGSPNSEQSTFGLVNYLIGNKDFYKVICTKESVQIQGFNFENTLNVPRTHMPKFVIAIDEYDGGLYSKTVRLDRGMTFNFRIHLASKSVEPSLKFDVQAVSLPASEIYTNHITFH